MNDATAKVEGCELCTGDGGRLVLANEWLRVVLVDEADLPGFARVIWNAHVREMTDLDQAARRRLLAAVLAVESAQRQVLAPHKVNLASLGNVTPHLHWHVIPRFADDSHFPQPVWGVRQRTPPAAALAARRAALGPLQQAIAEALGRADR
jgi:diadenosine tetraphosphate (Ap4A) HIT family hydrolase